MYAACLICSSTPSRVVLNDLSMRKCPDCGLIWREEFDVPIKYYQEKPIDPSSQKIRARVANSHERIDTFKKHADLNNLCDVGTGEGIFLKVLGDRGYRNVVGIEPSERISDFVGKNKLCISNGTIDDIGAVVREYSIHTVTLLHLIEHLPDPRQSLEKVYGCLQEGDSVVLETPKINSYSLKKRKYRHKLIYPEHLFYFNERNIQTLLKQTGFTIVARGSRDFNQRNLSMRESLFRLGLLGSDSPALKRECDNRGSLIKREKIEHSNNFAKKIARKLLSFSLTLLSRRDYVWVVARK